MTAALWVILPTFAVILASGASIGVGLGLSSAITMSTVMGTPLIAVVQKMFTAVDSYSFLAVPFFMLAGAFMSDGGVTRRIVNFSMALVGALAGGLALVVAVAGMFFAALSGSSAATTAAIGASMIDEMERRGYPRSFAAAVVASGGTVGIVIPPSVTLVVYGSIANTSIADLFIGGVVPGLFMGVSMCVLSWFISKKKGYRGEGSFSFRRIVHSLKDCSWALMMPVIILGGIYGGIFTPTEAAGVACAYGLIVGLFIYRELKLRELKAVILGSASSTGMVLFIMACAAVFGYVMARYQMTNAIAEFIISLCPNKYVFLLLVNILLLIVGCFMETTAAILILAPIFAPILTVFGISPVHFGVVMCINLAIGCATPPLGLNLFVAAGLTKDRVEVVVNRHTVGYILLSIAILFLITYVPDLVMLLPNSMM